MGWPFKATEVVMLMSPKRDLLGLARSVCATCSALPTICTLRSLRNATAVSSSSSTSSSLSSSSSCSSSVEIQTGTTVFIELILGSNRIEFRRFNPFWLMLLENCDKKTTNPSSDFAQICAKFTEKANVEYQAFFGIGLRGFWFR